MTDATTHPTPPTAPGRGSRPSRRVLVATPVTPRIGRPLSSDPAVALRPELAKAPERLGPCLAQLRPHTLVVGPNPVDRATIEQWVAAVPTGPDLATEARGSLLIVRRGTSLAAIDTVAAAEHGVDVANTPEVNARYVAEHIVDQLFAPPRDVAPPGGPVAAPARPDTVGLVGAGNINGRVARAAAARGCRVVVCTPTLRADHDALVTWRTLHSLPDDALEIAPDVAAVFAAADLVSIAVPLTTAGPDATEGLVRPDHLRSFAGRRVVSVSEPDVFTDEAILHAYGRDDLDVVLDNAEVLLAPVRRRITEALPQGGEGGEGGSQLRPGFTLSSAAMWTPGCSEDLDQAFLAVVAAAELRVAPPVRVPRRSGQDVDLVIVGGGIVGLTTALALRDRGFERVRLIDAAPADRSDPDRQGTTFAGANGRHMSATETVPHADASRADVLARPPSDGGWLLRDPASLSVPERAWVEAFKRSSDSPGLHAVTADLVIAVNRLGIDLWQELFDRHPGVFAGLRLDTPLARAYLSDDDLAAGLARQSRLSDHVRELSEAEVARDWPGLSPVARMPTGERKVSGVIQVDGYAVNVHELAAAIGERLRGEGVAVQQGSAVERIERLPGGVGLHLSDGSTVHAERTVLTVGGRDLHALLHDVWAASWCVQQTLGVWLTVRNPGINRPLKIHAAEPVGVVNVTLSPDGSLVHFSGGFGFLGLAGPSAGEPLAAALTTEVEHTVAAVFPTLRRAGRGLEVVDRRTCQRPMTPDGLPVVDALDAFDGRVVVAAGTNAGGMVQAPAIAALVAQLVDGQPGCAQLAMAADRPALTRYPRSRGGGPSSEA